MHLRSLVLAIALAACTAPEVAQETTAAAAATGTAPTITSMSLSATSIARPTTGALFVDLRLAYADADGDALGLEIVRVSPEGVPRTIAIAGAWRFGVNGAAGNATYPLAIHPSDGFGVYRYDVVVTDRARHRSKSASVSLTIAQGAASPLAVTGSAFRRAARSRSARQSAPGRRPARHRSGSATPSMVTVDSSGVRANGPLPRLGDFVLADALVDAPPWNGNKLILTTLRVPPELDLDPGAFSMVKEGATLPVLIAGGNFGTGQIEVVAATGTVVGPSSSRPATADELAKPTIAGVQLGTAQTQLGFTFRSAAIPTLNAGDRMQVGFAIRRFAGGPNPAEVRNLPESWFAVLGLPELQVTRKSVAQRDLFATDGTPIDARISETGCQALTRCAMGDASCTFPATGCYSEIDVEFGATLGIGIPLTNAWLPDASGAPVQTDLSNLDKVQARYGHLPWADGVAASAKLFVPFREHVEIDVAGTVKIGGQIYLGGMTGGENQELRYDPSQPDQSEQARRAGVGGLVASLAGEVFPSGGMGGDGGVTTGNGEDAVAGDGNAAGNGLVNAGKGRLADGAPLDQNPPAWGGKGLRHPDRPLLGFINGVADAGADIVALLTGSGVPETDKFLHLLGGATNTDYGPLPTQLDFIATGAHAYSELSGTQGKVAAVGRSLFTPNAQSYAPNPDLYGGRGGHARRVLAAADRRGERRAGRAVQLVHLLRTHGRLAGHRAGARPRGARHALEHADPADRRCRPVHRETTPVQDRELFDVDVVHETGANGGQHNVDADFRGNRTLPVTLQPGFSSVYVQTFVGDATPLLLKRHVLYLP